MSFARGLLSGFFKEGLDKKAARDEMYADMVREAGQEFRKTSQLFRKEEKNIENRFNIIQATHGTPMLLYMLVIKGLTKTDYGTNLVVRSLNKDPVKKLKMNLIFKVMILTLLKLQDL